MHTFPFPPSVRTHLIKTLAVVACAVLGLSHAVQSAPNSDLTADDILRTVREAQAGRNETLDGQLRTGEGKVLPFRLTARGPTVRYQFPGPPPTTVQVRYNDDNSQLEEVSSENGTERLNPANFDKKVLGTDLSFEDLALRFVYWKRAILLEPDDATTFPAHKLRLNSPSHQSQYAYVLLWVATQSGAFLQAEGYNFDGKLIKRMRVVDGQKLNGKWYLKSLNIENVDPANGRTRSRTYLEIKGLVPASASTSGA